MEMGKAKAGTVLVIDDDPFACQLLSQFLSLRGFSVRTAGSGPEAFQKIREEEPQVIILDMYMPGMSGEEVFRSLRKRGYRGEVIVLTAGQDQNLLQEMLRQGAMDVMRKPVHLSQLALAIETGVAFHGDPSAAHRRRTGRGRWVR